MRLLYLLSLCAIVAVACQNDPKTTSTVDTSTSTPKDMDEGKAVVVSTSDKNGVVTVADTIPNSENSGSTAAPSQPTTSSSKEAEVSEEYDPYRDISVGTITNACQLVTEAEIRKRIPGFSNVQEIRMTPRNSPDNHASACECNAMNEKKVFVIGYRKNPANLQYIDEIIAKGEFREYAPDIPPYQPVAGLGQKAAFNTKHGYLKWVGDNGVLVYTYVFPTTVQNVDTYQKVLYDFAQDIDARFNAK